MMKRVVYNTGKANHDKQTLAENSRLSYENEPNTTYINRPGYMVHTMAKNPRTVDLWF